VSALDVLLIITELNAGGSRDLRNSGLPRTPYFDVSGESFLSALDVLSVINFINARSNGGGGAGEAARPPVATDPAPVQAGAESTLLTPAAPPVEKLSRSPFADDEFLSELETLSQLTQP
ncbi:MAG: hypothetical protein KDA45_07545, partial [Planctomycetales bacterium]|nr:hypothetical protein [Planctomycetales bacterium]